MKTKKSLTLTVLTMFTAMVLLSPGALAASPAPLTLSITGAIQGAGSQNYSIAGGKLVFGLYNGQPLSGPLSYQVEASVNGMSTSGSASFTLGSGSSQIKGNIQLVDELPAAVFPLDFSTNPPSNCSNGCTSQIPFMFTGMLTLTSKDGGSAMLPVGIESAYFNPFGGPIVIASLDNPTNPTFLLVVTYSKASIDWSQVLVQGTILGSFGSNPVSGFYASVTNSHENLVAATEQDHGQIAFVGMTDPSLNAIGTLSGTTTFSLAGSEDCSSLTGVTGTCTYTGASSTGQFQMTSASGSKIVGSFSTVWSVPSLFTTTQVIASVTHS